MTAPIWPARPTLYRGIRMRSRTEARVAAWLDFYHVDWVYEPECFADETGQYLPDFRIDEPGCPPDYLEVKGVAPDLGAIQRQMEIVWSSVPDCHLTLMIVDQPTWRACQQGCLDSRCRPSIGSGQWKQTGKVHRVWSDNSWLSRDEF